MKTAIVKASALGTNCWSAARFTGGCHTCGRYDRCNYPERVPNEEFDAIRSEAARLKQASDALYRRLNEMKGQA